MALFSRRGKARLGMAGPGWARQGLREEKTMKGILWIGVVGLLALSCTIGTRRGEYVACCNQCTCGCDGGEKLCLRTSAPRQITTGDTRALVSIAALGIAGIAYGWARSGLEEEKP